MAWDPYEPRTKTRMSAILRKLNGRIREMGPAVITMVWNPGVEWIWERMVANSQRMTEAGSDLTGSAARVSGRLGELQFDQLSDEGNNGQKVAKKKDSGRTLPARNE